MMNIFDYNFIRMAFLVGILLATSCAVISPFLVFSNKSLTVDSLSHTSFAGIIIGLLLHDEALWIAILFTLLASLAITFFSKKNKGFGDTALGVTSTISLAIGFVLVSLNKGFNISIESLLIGSIFSVSALEVVLIGIATIVIIGFVFFFYPSLLSMTFDAEYAKLKGVKTELLEYLFGVLTAFLIVTGIRTGGVLIMSTFVIFPALIAKNFCSTFKANIFLSLIISISITIIGIFSAHYLKIPASASIALLYAFVLLISILQKNLKRA